MLRRGKKLHKIKTSYFEVPYNFAFMKESGFWLLISAPRPTGRTPGAPGVHPRTWTHKTRKDPRPESVGGPYMKKVRISKFLAPPGLPGPFFPGPGKNSKFRSQHFVGPVLLFPKRRDTTNFFRLYVWGNSYTTVNCAKFLPFHYVKLRSLRFTSWRINPKLLTNLAVRNFAYTSQIYNSRLMKLIKMGRLIFITEMRQNFLVTVYFNI